MQLKTPNSEQLKTTTTTRIKTTKMASSLTVEGGGGGSGSGGGNGDNNGGGGSGGVAEDDKKNGKHTTNNNNNNNNNNDAQSQHDSAEMKLKRQTLAQRKQELELLLSEKSWMLQQLQKQEAQIVNGNYEYLNTAEIFANLAQQYKQEQQQQQQQPQPQHHHHGTGSTAILRRKTATGVLGMTNSSKESQNIINNNNNSSSSNRKSELSNRSSEYDNYPIAAHSSSSCGNLAVDTGSIGAHSNLNINLMQQHQLPMKQTAVSAAKKRTTAAAATNYSSYLQQMQQHQQQQQQQHIANDQLYLQQYLAEQNYLQQKITLYQQRQQQQQQHQHHAAPDVISLYSVNSANVAMLRQQHVAPQQLPQQSTVVQCDKYYLSPTHQNHSNASGCSFIKSSQNIKKYTSPAASPTSAAASGHLGSTMTLGIGYELQNMAAAQQQHHTLQHYHHAAGVATAPTTARQLDAISLSPSYAVSMDAAIGGGNIGQQQHNMRWRSHTHIPVSSPLISPTTTTAAQHASQQHYHSQLSVDTASKSHSTDMLAHMASTAHATTTSSLASINTLPTIAGGGVYSAHMLPQQQQQKNASQKGKPFDEISISSLNSGESQKKAVVTAAAAVVKPKQWLESSLDGPIIRSTPTTELVEFVQSGHTRSAHHHSNQTQHHHKTQSAAAHHHHHHPKHKLSSQSMSVASTSSGVGLHNATNSSHSGSVSGNVSAARHYSMSKHTAATNRQALQDDTARYTKLSQSTSYLHALESASSNSDLTSPQHHHAHASPLAYQYLPPKPTANATTASVQPTPPPRPPPALEKSVAAPIIAPGLVAAAVANATSTSVLPAVVNSPLLAPDIRIESPKNMTVVQQATFQPYKEVTKPFEMSDFYKYSTKFRQKENTPTAATAAVAGGGSGGISGANE